MDNQTTKLLTTDDAAALLQVDAATVRRLIKRGDLKATRLCDGPRARMRIQRGDLLAFIERKRA